MCEFQTFYTIKVFSLYLFFSVIKAQLTIAGKVLINKIGLEAGKKDVERCPEIKMTTFFCLTLSGKNGPTLSRHCW